jgi:copper chaperone CopZ
MKQLTFLLLCVGMLLGASQVSAQSSNKGKGGPNAEVKESTFKVYGNCGMCKKRIETAAKAVPGVKEANWSIEEKKLTVSYSNTPGALKKIKEKVAGVGHDTDETRAKDKVYKALHGCCQYDRPNS